MQKLRSKRKKKILFFFKKGKGRKRGGTAALLAVCAVQIGDRNGSGGALICEANEKNSCGFCCRVKNDGGEFTAAAVGGSSVS